MPLFSPLQSSLVDSATPSQSQLALSPIHPGSSQPLSPRPGHADPPSTLPCSVQLHSAVSCCSLLTSPVPRPSSHACRGPLRLLLSASRGQSHRVLTAHTEFLLPRAPGTFPSSSPASLPVQRCPWASLQQGFLSFGFTALLPLPTQGKLSLPPSLLQPNLHPFQIQT